MPTGSHELEFTVNNLPHGVYFYRIVVDSYGEAGQYQEVKKDDSVDVKLSPILSPVL